MEAACCSAAGVGDGFLRGPFALGLSSQSHFAYSVASDSLVARRGEMEAAPPVRVSSSELQQSLCQVLTGKGKISWDPLSFLLVTKRSPIACPDHRALAFPSQERVTLVRSFNSPHIWPIALSNLKNPMRCLGKRQGQTHCIGHSTSQRI